MKNILVALAFLAPALSYAGPMCAVITRDEKGELTKISAQKEFQPNEGMAAVGQMEDMIVFGNFTEKSIMVGLATAADQKPTMAAISDGNTAIFYNITKDYAAVCVRGAASMSETIKSLR